MTASTAADGGVTTSRDGTRCLTQSININATPEKVWALITRIATITDWYETWHRVEPTATDTHLRAGTSFRLLRQQAGRADVVAQCHVTEASELTRLQWEQSQPHKPKIAVTFELVPHASDGTTELRQSRSWTTPAPQSDPSE